jgi:hypothetical protein
MRRSTRPSPKQAAVLAVATLCTVGAPTPVLSQATRPDSAELLGELHEMQREFERYRESRTPVHRERDAASCDERIGQICIWFGGDEGESFPAELREVQQARVELIRAMADGLEQVADSWIMGQLVHYLAESRNLGEAERVARACGIAEAWWCSALLGYVLHLRTEFVESEAAFREALAGMPAEERHGWTSPRYVFTRDAEGDFNDLADPERDLAFDLLWRLSDPLFLFEGNDRLTDHLARLVIARNRLDAADPLRQEWGEDLEETLIRYGRNTGYSRSHDPSRMMSGGLQDTRRMIGHHHPKSAGYLFPERFLESPSEIPPESWITAPRESRTWYAPPYAPDIRGLETQVGRFRREYQMLVVGAYRPTVVAPDDPSRTVPAWSPEGGVDGPPAAGLFMIPEDGRDPLFVRSIEAEGVLSIRLSPGRYVTGLEVADIRGRRAWRARQGTVQLPLEPGMVDVSDLMILNAGTPLPESLDDAIPHVRPGVRLSPGERFPVVWEVYGLRIREPVRVTIGFSRGRPDFLERVGDFLGVLEPEGDVDITFDDTGPEAMQAVFRSIELTLPDLDPGEYTLHLRLELSGRTPVVTSRPIIVERGR